MRQWSGPEHHPIARTVRAEVLEGSILRRRSHLLCQGGRSRLGSFRFAINLRTLFQSLTTIVRSGEDELKYKMAIVVCIALVFTNCQKQQSVRVYEMNSRALPLDRY